MQEALLPDGKTSASTSRAAVFQTSYLRRPGTIFAVPKETGSENAITQRALSKLHAEIKKLDERLAAMALHATTHDTREELARYSADERSNLRSVARGVVDMALHDRAVAEERVSNLLSLPAVRDAREELRDEHLRDAFERLTDEQRTRVRQSLGDGTHDDLLVALARAPLAEMNPDAMAARGIWTARMEREHADDLREANDQIAGAEALAASARGYADLLQ